MGLFSRFMMVFKAKANAAIESVEDPRQLVDYAYEQQKELLRRTKEGLIEVASSRVRLERQADKLQSQVPQIEAQAERALGIGREDLARLALQRKQSVQSELEQLAPQVGDITREERRLTATEQQLAARIEEFRVRKDTVSARYSAAEAQVRVSSALSGVSGEFAEIGVAMGRALEKTERMESRAQAIGGLMEGHNLALPDGVSDPVERELNEAFTDQSVEDELAAIKKRLGPGDPPPSIESGT
jgi:phage shock protein A